MLSPRFLLPALLAALLAAPAYAAADPRADDAAQLFRVMCIEHQDQGAYATTAFDSDPAAAQRLDAAQLAEAVGPQLGSGFGWVMNTPAGGEAILAIAPALNSCSVVVRAADIDSMRETFTGTVEGFAAAITAKGGKVVASPVTASLVDNINVDQFGWDITATDGAEWVITGLLAAKPNADRQHLLTFARVK
jgi:hypothetical protein